MILRNIYVNIYLGLKCFIICYTLLTSKKQRLFFAEAMAAGCSLSFPCRDERFLAFSGYHDLQACVGDASHVEVGFILGADLAYRRVVFAREGLGK